MSKKEMLINVSEGEECRIAIVEDGRLEELYMERTSSTSHVGNIYKGRVTNVEPSIQAAFIDFGLGRNGFLHISDLMPEYFGRDAGDYHETVGRKMARRDRPPIQRCLRRGDDIVVQIIKEGIGTKGPTLSTYLSIPGRILVMMPGMGKMGISRKIEDEVERRRLRQILDGLKPPKDVGFIIRTAGVGKTKTEIQRDLTYLTRLWQTFVKKRDSGPPPLELYTEGDLVTRTVRDVFSVDVESIVADNKDVAKRVKDVIKLANPRARNKVELHELPVPLFHKYGIEREIEQMYSRHVPLPSGGSLVIDSTEAIVAIDVNSGKFREHNDPETTAFRTDMEAADEIPRQLRLRDLGGVIIIDFIDLRFERHRRELEKRLHDNFQKDRAKTKVLRMSQFGIIEVTRQRMRPSLKRSIYFDCPHCKGAGLVKTPESMSLDVMRRLAIAASDLKVARIDMAVCADVSFYLLNKKRQALSELEARFKKKILIRTDASLGLDEMKLVLYDAREGLVILEELGMEQPAPPHVTQLGPRAQQQGGQGGGRGGQGRGRGGRFDNRRGGRDDRGRQNQDRQGPPRDRDDFDSAADAADEREEQLENEPLDAPAEMEPDVPIEAPEIVASEVAEVPPEENIDDAPGPIDQGPPRRDGQDRFDGDGPRRRQSGRGGGGGGGGGGGQAPRFQGNQGNYGSQRGGGYSNQNRQGGYGGQGNQGRQGGQGGHCYDRDRQPQEQSVGSGYVDEYDVGDEAGDANGNRATPSHDSPQPVGGPPSDRGETGGPRRRRRRGGRGRRRNRGDQPQDQFNNTGAPPPQDDGPHGEPHDQPRDEAIEDAGPDNMAHEEAALDAAERAEAQPAKQAPVEESAPRRRPPRGRGRPSTSRKPPAPPAAPPPSSKSPVMEDHNAIRTGSADRHLAGDEPVAPHPISRPRSFTDLDAIPDDFD